MYYGNHIAQIERGERESDAFAANRCGVAKLKYNLYLFLI